MDENQNPEKQAKSGQDHLREAAGNFKEAASAKVENIRQAAAQKADELRGAGQDKAQELRGAADCAWSDTKSQAKSWQAEGEAYVRDNPTKAVLMALGVGVLLGLMFRK
jgi:ElaB/YqjD/DUF883 family membrane-anchored ribosome-binding protein